MLVAGHSARLRASMSLRQARTCDRTTALSDFVSVRPENAMNSATSSVIGAPRFDVGNVSEPFQLGGNVR